MMVYLCAYHPLFHDEWRKRATRLHEYHPLFHDEWRKRATGHGNDMTRHDMT